MCVRKTRMWVEACAARLCAWRWHGMLGGLSGPPVCLPCQCRRARARVRVRREEASVTRTTTTPGSCGNIMRASRLVDCITACVVVSVGDAGEDGGVSPTTHPHPHEAGVHTAHGPRCGRGAVCLGSSTGPGRHAAYVCLQCRHLRHMCVCSAGKSRHIHACMALRKRQARRCRPVPTLHTHCTSFFVRMQGAWGMGPGGYVESSSS